MAGAGFVICSGVLRSFPVIISHRFRFPFANWLRPAAGYWSRPAAGPKLGGPSAPQSDSPMDHSTPTSTSSASARVVDVLVPVALNQTYSYRVPRGTELKPGDVVCVPLDPREVVAVVWAENPTH